MASRSPPTPTTSNGNRVERHTPPAAQPPAHYDAQDRLLRYGPATYTYTANGELLQPRLAGAQTTSYHLRRGLGNLLAVALARTARTIAYASVDGQQPPRRREAGERRPGAGLALPRTSCSPAAQLDGSGTLGGNALSTPRVVNVPDYMVKDGVTYRLLTNPVSVRLVVNAATGQVAQRIEYDAFGRVLSDTNPGFQPFGFAGGLYDAATGLVHFSAHSSTEIGALDG